MTGTEQVLLENWCQQFPSHSIGTHRLRRRRRALRERRRRRELHVRRLRPDGVSAEEPVRRSAGGVGGDADAADGRGRRAPQPGSAHAAPMPVTLRRHRPALDPLTGAAMPDNPLVGGATPSDDPHHRLRPPQPVPHGAPARHERALDRRRRLERLGGDQPHRRRPATSPSRTSAGRATRASAGSRVTSGAGLDLCRGLYADARHRHRSLSTATTTTTQVVPGEACGTGSSSITGLAFYGAGSYPTTYDGALFFADYSPQLHLGDAARRRRRSRSGAPLHLRRRRADPVDLEIGPGGDLFYVDVARRSDSPHPLRRREPAADRRLIDVDETDGPRRSSCSSTARPRAIPIPATRSPTLGPRRRRRLRRLDRRRADCRYTVRRHVRRRSSASPIRTARPPRRRSTITAGNTRPTATIAAPGAATTWHAGEHDRASPARRPIPSRARSGRGAHLDARPPSLSRELPRAHRAERHRLASGSFIAPDHEYPTLPRAAAHRDRRRRPHGDQERVALSRRPST